MVVGLAAECTIDCLIGKRLFHWLLAPEEGIPRAPFSAMACLAKLLARGCTIDRKAIRGGAR